MTSGASSAASEATSQDVAVNIAVNQQDAKLSAPPSQAATILPVPTQDGGEPSAASGPAKLNDAAAVIAPHAGNPTTKDKPASAPPAPPVPKTTSNANPASAPGPSSSSGASGSGKVCSVLRDSFHDNDTDGSGRYQLTRARHRYHPCGAIL